ncbi:hypothetical protein U1Q18_012775 [Sarracenia purpurea var. burkii]
MDKPDGTEVKRHLDTLWGTWEELLLTCAVHRYGTKSWDSVYGEIRKRSSTSALHRHLTPHLCKQKYHDLKRRYTPPNGAVSPPDDGDKDGTVPWLDDLRKLRVTELKHELERYDLSIVSLQLKVKRLKEEREQSLREDENGGERSDLEKIVLREREGEENRGEKERESEPESVAGKPIAGEESDRDNQSVSESNSTDLKGEDHKTGVDDDEKEPNRTRIGIEPDTAGGSTKPVGEDSCNGSSDSIEKENPVRESVKAEPEVGVSDSPELWESVAESKGGGGEEITAKESSDMQSSASRSRKELELRSPSIIGDEPENEDQSPAVKRISAKPHSSIQLLEIVRSHKLGSVFERRLESQETPEYKNLIRQHIDLETIRMKLKGGRYSSCNSKFYRDLLLLFNNAILFFGKESREFAAAIELRQLISKDTGLTNLKLDPSSEERTSVPIKPEPEPSDSPLLKPKILGPMIVCRKRSSIAAKELGSSSGGDRKREQKAALLEDKPILDWKQPNNITKKRTSDRFVPGSGSLKKNGKNRANTNPSKNSESLAGSNQGKGASSSEQSEPKSEKTTTASKKRNAASFLNRMKQSSAANNGLLLLDSLKNYSISSNSNKAGGGAEQKKSGNGKGDGKKDHVSRRSSGGRQAKGQGSPVKRTVGRPPKRTAAPPSVAGKRSRDGGDKEGVVSKQPKKRSRK